MAAAAILKKSKNSHISATVQPILMKFANMMHFEPLERHNRYKFNISQIQDGGGRHLEKLKNRHISAAVQPILTQFGTMMHFEPLDCPDRQKFKFCKSKVAAGILTI